MGFATIASAHTLLTPLDSITAGSCRPRLEQSVCVHRNAEPGTQEAMRSTEILKRMCRLSPEHVLQWVKY
jgi:hypothetical protein